MSRYLFSWVNFIRFKYSRAYFNKTRLRLLLTATRWPPKRYHTLNVVHSLSTWCINNCYRFLHFPRTILTFCCPQDPSFKRLCMSFSIRTYILFTTFKGGWISASHRYSSIKPFVKYTCCILPMHVLKSLCRTWKMSQILFYPCETSRVNHTTQVEPMSDLCALRGLCLCFFLIIGGLPNRNAC